MFPNWTNWAYRLFPPRRVDSVLLNLMLPIGDTLFTTPTVRALRRRFPDAHFAALVFPTNAGVLHANEDIDEIILHPTGQTFAPLTYVRFLLDMWRHRFTIAVEFRPYTWWLSVLCGAWRRLSFDIPVYQWFIPLGDRPWMHRHAIESYATVVRLLGLHVDASRLVVRATDADRSSLRALLMSMGLPPGQRMIALHPGGEGFRGMKRWEARRFSALADRLAERHGACIVIMGGRDELPLAQDVADGMSRNRLVVNGCLSLGQSIALLETSYLFVGNDSAPLHMAASLGTPTVGIYGPTSLENYRPVGPHVEIARAGIVCSPCFYFVGSQPVWAGSHCHVPTCLHSLSIDTVLEATDRALATSDDR